MEKKPASELQIRDIGRTVSSISYPNKNKTARPRPVHEYVIGQIYAHANGNILIDDLYYLKADTVLTFLD